MMMSALDPSLAIPCQTFRITKIHWSEYSSDVTIDLTDEPLPEPEAPPAPAPGTQPIDMEV
jgi:hypothetical protein